MFTIPRLLLHGAEDGREEEEEVRDLDGHGDGHGHGYGHGGNGNQYLLISPKPTNLLQDVIKGHLEG